jgi:SAM-dependent methyltransferase
VSVTRHLAQGARRALRRTFPGLALRARRRLPGQFQDRSHTQPDRYPWLFEFAKSRLGDSDRLRILSFGCSTGDEVFTLRRYFPGAAIVGIDVDPGNIAVCQDRARSEGAQNLTLAVAATTEHERAETFDAIFCLGVLCLGDLTALGFERSDPHFTFDEFERTVTDLARCLKPGGLLLFHSTNFRFGDTRVADAFDVAFEADPSQLGTAVIFDRGNRLMPGERYPAAAFRKHAGETPAT